LTGVDPACNSFVSSARQPVWSRLYDLEAACNEKIANLMVLKALQKHSIPTQPGLLFFVHTYYDGFFCINKNQICGGEPSSKIHRHVFCASACHPTQPNSAQL